jgi:hypothetical protein
MHDGVYTQNQTSEYRHIDLAHAILKLIAVIHSLERREELLGRSESRHRPFTLRKLLSIHVYASSHQSNIPKHSHIPRRLRNAKTSRMLHIHATHNQTGDCGRAASRHVPVVVVKLQVLVLLCNIYHASTHFAPLVACTNACYCRQLSQQDHENLSLLRFGNRHMQTHVLEYKLAVQHQTSSRFSHSAHEMPSSN